MSTHIEFRSPKGGQGCSTTVVMVAQTLAELGVNTLVVDADRSEDIYRIFNTTVAVPCRIGPKLELTSYEGWAANENRYDFVLWDYGTSLVTPLSDARQVWVVRNCYLALSHLHVRRAAHHRIDDVIYILESGRALKMADMDAAIRLPVAGVIHADPVTARMVDAGLLISRRLQSVQLRNIVDYLVKEHA